MSSIAESLYTYLSTNATIIAATDSIYFGLLPQTNPGLPALTYSQDDVIAQPMMIGAPSSVKRALMSIDCWDKDPEVLHDLAEVVVGQMAGYRGTFGAHTVDFIAQERQLDLYEQETGLHRISLQFNIAYY